MQQVRHHKKAQKLIDFAKCLVKKLPRLFHQFFARAKRPLLANNFFVNAHVEVSSKVDIMISHDMIDNIERDFKEQLNIVLSIHLDPIETDNEEVNFNKKKVQLILKNIDESLDLVNKIEGIGEVEPMTHCLDDFEYELREDVVEESVDIEDLLSNCDDRSENEVIVPKVVG